MKSQNDLNEEILAITVKIKTEFPELIRYLNEMPENFLSIDHKGVYNKELKDYLDSLNQLIEAYSKEH